MKKILYCSLVLVPVVDNAQNLSVIVHSVTKLFVVAFEFNWCEIT